MTERVEKKSFNENAGSSNKKDAVLMLFNDDVNSFDYVIESLVEVCFHTNIQAEQCALITHYKGVSEVKKGSEEILKEMEIELINKGLKASIK
ncbi:MAG: ATP-dependent Clp protease adaptor ClpS [Bacteroidales bacterium]|nr:ATP-dependent Clp protease adaptor ClpS [Bacteroidales bacterium]MCF8389432.1 ATP-dependent Clp protease adaptor ClpS [Bacteroidales bacterium]